MCVCVCVCVRERERDRGDNDRWLDRTDRQINKVTDKEIIKDTQTDRMAKIQITKC